MNSFANKCRICLEECDIIESYQFFKIGEKYLIELMKEHLPHADWTDTVGKPDKVCKICATRLVKIDNFNINCIINQNRLNGTTNEVEQAVRSILPSTSAGSGATKSTSCTSESKSSISFQPTTNKALFGENDYQDDGDEDDFESVRKID